MRTHGQTAAAEAILVTGARGLVGAAVVRHLVKIDGRATIYALSRTPHLIPPTALASHRVVPLRGEITRRGLRLDLDARRALEGRVGVVIHAAADTRFSQTASEAHTSNVVGTENVLELVGAWRRPPRICFVSTAFVAGRRTGPIAEEAGECGAGWVNPYERSKFEAEGLVRASGLPFVICRPTTIVCDSPAGEITQFNAAHRALRLCSRGLVPMLPGADDAAVDVVPCDYVSRAVAELSGRTDAEGATYHLAAGEDAMSLVELFDRTYAYWAARDGRSRAAVRPILTDLETYRLFEATVLETAEPGLRRITRALSHFVPQLALQKSFQTVQADAALGYRPAPVRSYWAHMLSALGAWRPHAAVTPCSRSVA